MPNVLANEFSEILPTVTDNTALRSAVLELVANAPIVGKSTDGGDRLERFRQILQDLINGEISLPEAYGRVSIDLPAGASAHSGNTRVFPSGWDERLVRIQLSRFYNQAVLEQLLAEGEAECFVPHSSAEDASSACSVNLAGRNHETRILYDRLIRSYAEGQYIQDLKIPHHPHCTHVVTRVSKSY